MESKSPIGCVDKALRTLERLGEVGLEGQSLTRLAGDLGLGKTSQYRLLQALSSRGFVEKDAKGNYRLGTSIRALAESSVQDESLRCVLHGGLAELSAKLNETCHLGVLAEDQVIYIDKVANRQDRTLSAIGWRNPAMSTALGRAILCHKFLTFQSFANCAPTTIQRRTAYTHTSPEKIWRELMNARVFGFAKEEQENELGLTCIGMALLRGGAAIAGVSVTIPHERVKEGRIPQLVSTVRECLEPHLPPGLVLQKPAYAGERRNCYA